MFAAAQTVLMPTYGHKDTTINGGIILYDDGGPSGNHSSSCDGSYTVRSAGGHGFRVLVSYKLPMHGLASLLSIWQGDTSNFSLWVCDMEYVGNSLGCPAPGWRMANKGVSSSNIAFGLDIVNDSTKNVVYCREINLPKDSTKYDTICSGQAYSYYGFVADSTVDYVHQGIIGAEGCGPNSTQGPICQICR